MFPGLTNYLEPQRLFREERPWLQAGCFLPEPNSGKVCYVEQQMCKMPRLFRSGSFGKIDVLVVEALAITEEELIPTTSVGLTHYLLDAADEIIVEINRSQPEFLFGMHDVSSKSLRLIPNQYR